ncbi:unnamed protein product [Rotaria sordida]|uniref:Uncharacterized protein n=1 Tax=Rotaria sordida TaxID=392033 RepID=A0A814M5S6_9BILA|nr:unnamed protein product [Rotaria sordida]CAF4036925.1 unnamed protein product [Rotaria sordida]
MGEYNIPKSLPSDELWLKVINEGVEDRVEVNQRMLIDKMLARYSSDFVVYRELIQNSDDAQATSFTLEITCDPFTATQTYESINSDYLSMNQGQTNDTLEGIGQSIKNHFGVNTIYSNPDKNDQTPTENDFNNCVITEIRAVNNGHVFSEDDWKRVITIAEGNTNVDAIGQFGVGFFSVFSYSERPMIQSGKHCLAFVWQNGKSLTTFRKELPFDEQSSSTSIILSMKNKYILQTKPILETNEIDNKNTKNRKVHVKSKRRTKSKKNTITNEIVPTLDLIQLKAYFTKVLAFTKYINELIIKINGTIVFQANKTRKTLSSTKLSTGAKKINSNNEHNLLRLKSLVQTEETFSIVNNSSITLNHIDVEAEVIIDKGFHKQIQDVLKKSLPSTIHIEFLFPSNNIFEDEQWKTLTNNNLNNQILKGLIPFKIHDGEIIPCGQIFIGLATQQSTGIGMHVFSHLIPTIERENIDLQDPYISIWNEQLLTCIGKIVKFIYDQTILDVVNNTSQQSNQQLNAILSLYAFQPSAPNKDIGRILLDGFFSSDKDVLVPVKRSPSEHHLSLISSTQAFLTTSKHIQSFLPVPLVPFDIGKNDFFKALKKRQWIEEIDHDTILVKAHESILEFDEFIGLLRWLCSNDINNKSYMKQILLKIRYRETRQSSIIKLEKIEFYDTLNLSSLPLPPNVLPSNVVSHISREDLQRRLSLSAISMKNLIEFYLVENQQHLFQNENTSRIILSFISQRWNQFNETESNKIKGILSNLKCIPTNQGMNSPNESYIRSSSLSANLPIITLYIPQISTDKNQKDKQESTDYPVSIEFLKSIGCRTIHVPTSTNNLTIQSNSSSDDSQTLQTFIQDVLQQRKNMSDNDLRALKQNPCIIGTTLESNSETKRKHKPCDLHFPSVANRLQWNQLPIIDWLDINPRSQDYSFLKELGVREVPDLHKLIARIDQEHYHGSKTKVEYKLPNALVFFAENFQQYYSKVWKNANIKIPFLPSSSPDVNQSTEVILTTPEVVFKEPGPLCPSLLPDVLRCFSQYFDIGLLGVKQRPPLAMAFDILMERRNQLLTVESAPTYFSYFNKLEGLNRAFIQRISNRAFIPLPGSNIFVKPSQVFIRSKCSSTGEASPDKDINAIDDTATHGLIDYLDYGRSANSFLLSIGVLSYPSAENLADLLIERQASYFAQMKDYTNDMISAKLYIYTNCLKQLAAVSNVAQHLNVEPLRSRLINKPWCLAYQIIERSDGNRERVFKIAKPTDIYLDDDHQSAIDLRPLCAPDEPELTKLYELFGSKWLSESVKRTLMHKGKFFATERSKKLHDLIHYRLDMLFVNNRGERMDNIDEKGIELLRTKFFVYETEGIQCQLTFQNRTVTLNSIECSSCALEHEKNKVTLYIQKDIPTLDYIDIATELTRFVYKKPLDALVHSISDKLASPLETLKRRGIPVDRLLKIAQQQQQQPIKLALQNEQTKIEKNVQKPSLQHQEQSFQLQEVQQINHKLEQHQQNDQVHRGFFQSLKDFLVPIRYSPSSLPNNSVDNISSIVERDCINHFGRYKSSDEADIEAMIRTSRSYSATEFNQSEHSRNESNNSCEFVPASTMIRYDHYLHGISLYIDRNVTLTETMIDQGKQLAQLLSGLAKDVFNMSVQTMHLFRDIDSARIAFNSNGALFFNLRYFEQVFVDELKPYIHNTSSSIPIVRTIVNFYFMVACHELSHNVDSSHDLNFISRLERVSVRFMDAKDVFLSKFSFQ